MLGCAFHKAEWLYKKILLYNNSNYHNWPMGRNVTSRLLKRNTTCTFLPSTFSLSVHRQNLEEAWRKNFWVPQQNTQSENLPDYFHHYDNRRCTFKKNFSFLEISACPYSPIIIHFSVSPLLSTSACRWSSSNVCKSWAVIPTVWKDGILWNEY